MSAVSGKICRALCALALGLACSKAPATTPETKTAAIAPLDAAPAAQSARLADVQAVRGSGAGGALTFSVELASPDMGCQQYADWWEVLSPDGRLLYRRILGHSHVDEQPFSRSGGPVEVEVDDEVVVRAHMNPGGYGGQAMRGSVTNGFRKVSLESGFAAEVASQAPQPEGCAF